MERRGRAFALLIAVTTWAALALQFGLSVGAAVAGGAGIGGGLVAFFGYFTILTNILVATAVTAPIVNPDGTTARFFLRGSPATGVAAAILLVAVGYHLLLRETWDPQGPQLIADLTLHYVTPLLYTIYWARYISKEGVHWRRVPWWCAYPLGYFAYALLRGALIGSYPYPFIDVRLLGYGATLGNAMLILIGLLALCGLLILVARLTQAWGWGSGSG